MRKFNFLKKYFAGVLAAAMLASSLPDMTAGAAQLSGTTDSDGYDTEYVDNTGDGYYGEIGDADNIGDGYYSENGDADNIEDGYHSENGDVYQTEDDYYSESSDYNNEYSADDNNDADHGETEYVESVSTESDYAESVSTISPDADESCTEESAGDASRILYRYVAFPESRNGLRVKVRNVVGVAAIENAAPYTIYKVSTEKVSELVIEASVPYGSRLEPTDGIKDIISGDSDPARELSGGKWIYRYALNVSGFSDDEKEPSILQFRVLRDSVPVKVSGEAVVSGIDENGMAEIGSVVSIEVTHPGYALALRTEDDKGNIVYTAMELNYNNCYEFRVVDGAEFVIADPEKAGFKIINAETRKAKLTGAAGLKLTGLASSAQGYKDIVLNFTAIKNGSDGTEDENVYYEVKVTAAPKKNEKIPAGSASAPRYYYIPKIEDANTQSKSIQVNDGDLSEDTACTYEFSVRMVLINQYIDMPEQDVFVEEPFDVSLSGNSITKSFATKNLYYEDKLGFNKKKTSIYTGQQDLLVGTVRYSKKASYLHELTAVAYDDRGGICEDIKCVFKNDNDELYISANPYMTTGKYKIVVYAGIGEGLEDDSLKGGTLYRANTSFTLTVQPGINHIDTSNITGQAAVNNKNITFSAVPTGYNYGEIVDGVCEHEQKAKTQKFTYEIKSAVPDEEASGGYRVTEPDDKVKQNISVNKNGKVTVKKGYYVDPDTSRNFIAVIIKAADYEGNDTTATAFVQIVSKALVPTGIYIQGSYGDTYGTGSKYGKRIALNRADGASVIVLDQYGNNMNRYVNITPTDNSKGTAKVYVSQGLSGEEAYLYARKPGKVTIKATTKDGGKKSKTLKLSIEIPRVTQMCYWVESIKSEGFAATDVSTSKGIVHYKSPKGAVIKLLMGAKFYNSNEGQYYEYYGRDWFDWDYDIKGGKIKFDGDYWMVSTTAKTTEINVWLKADSSMVWTLEFINDGWNKKYEDPPNVKLIDGKLYSNRYSSIYDIDFDEYPGGVPYQQLTYRYDHGSYDDVKIGAMSESNPKIWVSDFDAAERTFKLNMDAGNDIKAGNYKYMIAFYRDGVLQSKPAEITVKVNKSSPVKFVSSYTLDAVNEGVVLKSTPSEFLPDIDDGLINANVNGKSNDFTEYFELVYVNDIETGGTKAEIKFKDTLSLDDRLALRGKKFTRYVKYSYCYGYSYIPDTTAKITIKIK